MQSLVIPLFTGTAPDSTRVVTFTVKKRGHGKQTMEASIAAARAMLEIVRRVQKVGAKLARCVRTFPWCREAPLPPPHRPLAPLATLLGLELTRPSPWRVRRLLLSAAQQEDGVDSGARLAAQRLVQTWRGRVRISATPSSEGGPMFELPLGSEEARRPRVPAAPRRRTVSDLGVSHAHSQKTRLCESQPKRHTVSPHNGKQKGLRIEISLIQS